MERVFRSLKSEWVPLDGYTDPHDVTRDITQYLGTYYNYHRPHRFNGGLSPVEYERRWEKAKTVSDISCPLQLARGLGINVLYVYSPRELQECIAEILYQDSPFLIEIKCDNQHATPNKEYNKRIKGFPLL
ncbi:transposase OrfAB, subunit B [Xenorhabdus miraniensis]|uniref:Transposase OrfAB, subunit B n=2 Tax=Xenorhabdus miraniensis TaxID=351674 RepID=A0A2D0JTZ5_9GAMM|nr:transposase OrfAB, subunit B [Xenorhabdus miraniensis]